MVKDDSFWTKLKGEIAGVLGKTLSEYRLKSQVWSPLKGDKLYLFYNDNGGMVAFSREYRTKNLDGNTHPASMTTTDTMVSQRDMDKTWGANTGRAFRHGFKKIPVIYIFRSETLYRKIKPQRGGPERTLSSYADCLGNHYFPMLILLGDIQPDLITGDARNRMINLTSDGANVQYLTWNQLSDPIKVEIETYFDQIYGLTSTPRISFDRFEGVGNALSGIAFRYVFMTAHIAVQDHVEELGSSFQCRVNFPTSVIGALNILLEEAGYTVGIGTEMVPLMIDSENDEVTIVVAVVSGEVWSFEHKIACCSDYGELQDELQQVGREQKEKTQQQTKPAEPKEHQL